MSEMEVISLQTGCKGAYRHVGRIAKPAGWRGAASYRSSSIRWQQAAPENVSTSGSSIIVCAPIDSKK